MISLMTPVFRPAVLPRCHQWSKVHEVTTTDHLATFPQILLHPAEDLTGQLAVIQQHISHAITGDKEGERRLQADLDLLAASVAELCMEFNPAKTLPLHAPETPRVRQARPPQPLQLQSR
jgi:hypothetical protein